MRRHGGRVNTSRHRARNDYFVGSLHGMPPLDVPSL
jgi:hypothetical protein